jgi:hypothetical protein
MATAAQLTFAEKFRGELDSQQVGVRTLARRLANRYGSPAPRNVESIRRRLNKYLREGVTPTAPTRHDIEAELGLERDSLKPDDDEEDHLMRPFVLVPIRIDYELLARAVDAGRAAQHAEPTASLAKATAGSDNEGA